jgi:chorismate mutase/prephenate dehydratase
MNDLPRVSYLGPEATFTHEAAILRFGEGAALTPVQSIDAVFDDVEGRRSRWGVVPIENAIEGTVNITLDRLLGSTLLVEGEIRLPIDIHLLTNAGSVEEVERILSHPHAVAQCRRWLRANASGVKIEEVLSTSLAAKMAAEDPGLAALGSRLAAEHYGLKIMEEKLDSEIINVTRFFVIGTEKPEQAAQSKTSLLFGLKNESGALYKALAPIAERELNMTKIESRPSRKVAWEYVFYMEIDGFAEEEAIAKGILELRNLVDFLRVLGSYPVLQRAREVK